MCNPKIMHHVVQQHLESPAMWAIFPLQDLLALSEEFSQRPAPEETINDPTNPRHYWRYRMHIRLETLLGDEAFLQSLRSLIQGALPRCGRLWQIAGEIITRHSNSFYQVGVCMLDGKIAPVDERHYSNHTCCCRKPEGLHHIKASRRLIIVLRL